MKLSKAQIVSRWEARNKRFLVSETPCEKHCRCVECFNAALDRLVDTSEVLTSDSRIGVSFDYEFSSDQL